MFLNGEVERLGAMDIEGKQYLSNPVFFADAFNYLLYDGEQVIKPENLQELDTTELTVPYGNNARVPVQKYRDLLKLWNAMMDENAIYVILGAELQDKVHYGMPVKDGLEATAEIRTAYPDIPIIALTANAFDSDRQLAMEAGCNEFLAKPVGSDKCLAVIARLLGE
jgi:DNA-binding NarL/FixJ family response regulator